MGLRLFHITEFAQSLLTPAAQREASHPGRVLLMFSLWVAVAGNLPLWRELARLPMNSGELWWIGTCFALLAAGTLLAVLTVFNWFWLLKPVLTLLLWFTALNALLLWTQDAPAPATFFSMGWTAALAHLRTTPWHWPLLLTLALLALLPTLLLWRMRIRRVPLSHLLPQNILCLMLAAVVLTLTWFAGRSALLALLQDQPRWLELLSPINSVLDAWRRI